MTKDKPTIDVEALIALCDEILVDYYYQEYAGATQVCLYCGAMIDKPHQTICPTARYKKIKGE